MASLSLAALGRLCRGLSAAGADGGALSPLSTRKAAEGDLQWLEMAARCRQDRAQAARLSKIVADGAGEDSQAGKVRHVLLAGDGALPGHPHAQVQGQTPSDLGYGRSDE